MSASTPSASKTLVWNLAIVLIGVVVLYSWHNQKQKEILAAKDAKIAQSVQLVSAKEQELGKARATEQALHGEMDALKTRHQNEKQDLADTLDTAKQANQALQDDMEALKTRHVQTLAAEQEKAKQAYTELQGQQETAKRQIASLDANIEQLKQSIADATAAHEARMAETKSTHEARIAQIEHRLKEKIAYYRTALQGSDPERAAQLADLEQQIQADRKTIDEGKQALSAIQEKEASLTQSLAGANRIISEKNAALARATATMQAAEESHATRIAAAETKISDLRGRLQAGTAALATLRQKHESEVAELTGSLDSAKRTLANVEAELGSAKDAAVKAQKAYEERIGEARAKISGLEQDVAQTHQKAKQELEASKREGQEAVTYVRGVYTELSKLGGRYTDQGMQLSLAEEDLRFRISKADLPEGEVPSLDRIAELLLKHPKLTARIEGHTDSKGRETTNLELSQQRADAVKQALVDRGVPAERMVTEGIGAARPIANNATRAGRRANRRVEVYVIED